MSDDDKGGFTWGLRPSGQPEEPENERSDATEEPEPAPPIDLGHFLALNQTELIAAATESHDATPAEPESNPIVLPEDPTVDDGEPTAAFDFRAPPPPPVDPIAPPVYHPGQSLPWEQPAAFDSALEGATEALAAEHVGLDGPRDESAPTSAIDSLFADDRFEEYAEAPVLGVVVPTAYEVVPIEPPVVPPVVPRAPRGPMPRGQKVLIIVAAALVAVIALAGLFFVGTRIGESMPVAVQTPAASAPATPAPAATEEPPAAPPAVVLGPVAPGVYEWKKLLGTECLDPFASAWEAEYTVVDCAAPHGGQLVYRGRFDDSATDAYPGVEALQARMNLLCSSPENIDYAAASQFSDIQISASYAGTEADWAAGNRNYFCFVSRESGEPLTANVATPPRAPVVVPVAPAPEP